MTDANKFIVFLCSSAIKKGDSKLSYRIANYIEQIGLGSIGSLEKLSMQHSSPIENQQRMIFLNDCRSGCVHVLTHGFEKDKFIYLDIHAHIHSPTFDIIEYVHEQLIPLVKAKWNLILPEPCKPY